MAAQLELRGIRAGYGGVEVLHGIDLIVPPGSIVALLGANGAGKSTTLKVIAGLVRPSAGAMLIEGHEVTGTSPEVLARLGVCLIPEGRGIFPNLTVRENLLMDTNVRKGMSPARAEDVAYDRFPILGSRRRQLAGTLSGGEQQMLALARALSTDPVILLLDEISMGLAPIVVDNLFQVVRELAAAGITIVVVEQFVAYALGIADYVTVMAQGRVQAVGEPVDVRDELASAYLGT